MERALTVEEKIQRAEQIYERRKMNSNNQIEIPKITAKTKSEDKDKKTLKKIIVQIILCSLFTFCIYVAQNYNLPFLEKVKEIMAYDENFAQTFNNGKQKIGNFVNTYLNKENLENGNDKNNAENSTNNNQNNDEKKEGESQENNNQENIAIGGSENKNENLGASQIDQDIQNVKNTTTFIHPIEGTIASKFGQRDSATGRVPKNHTGIDIAANLGTKIKSATDGEVVIASDKGDYGKHLKIQIGEVSVVYAHCSNLYVKQGDKVTQGQEIAEVGSTGNSTRTSFAF